MKMNVENDIPKESGFYLVPVGWLRPTDDNPRRAIDEGSAAFAGLVGSIRKQGILQPLVVRPHPVLEGVLDGVFDAGCVDFAVFVIGILSWMSIPRCLRDNAGL